MENTENAEDMGIIYKVINTANKKIYVGKTKELYGDCKFGLERIFKQHLTNATGNSKDARTDCPRFYNAIRKYGKSKFKVELLAKCKLSMCDYLEITYISIFDSTNPDMGYNISSGGKGRSVVHVNENVRKKISKYSNDVDATLNIRPYHKNGELIGYKVRRRNRGKQHQKMFASKENSIEENYELAVEWLNNLKTGKMEDNKYNKSNDLPRNINYVKENGKIIGYRVDILINGKKTTRNVQNKDKTLDELLVRAIEIKESILSSSKNP